MKTVFLFLNIRAYASDLLQTPYIEYLVTKYRVVIFFPENDGYDPQNYYQHENLTYVLIPQVRGRFFTVFDSWFRNELIRRFNSNPAVIWRNKRADNPDWRRVLCRTIGALLPRHTLGPDLFTAIEPFFVPGFSIFKKYVDEYAPSLILVATPGIIPADTLALLWAKRAGIPTAAVNFGWDNLTVYPRHVRKPDYLICWNTMQKHDAETYHSFDPARVFISGITRFDHYFVSDPRELGREAFLKSKGLDPTKKTVLYAAKAQGTFFRDFIRAFILWQRNNELHGPANLFVRIHPLDSMETYEEFKDISGVHIERGSTFLKQDDASRGHKVEMNKDDLRNMKETLAHSDACVNIASTVAVEAMAFDKPVIIAGFVPQYSDIASFYHFKPLTDYEAVSLAQSMDDIKQCLNRYFKNPSLHADGRKRVVEYMVAPTDGFSYRRNVDFLDQIIKNEETRP